MAKDSRGEWRIIHECRLARRRRRAFTLGEQGEESFLLLRMNQDDMMDSVHDEDNPIFPELSTRVMELVSRARGALFGLDSSLAARLIAECSSLGNRARQAEASCNTGLMVGISTPEEKMALVRVAQQCSRLGRIVHQVLVMVQNVQEIAGEVLPEDVEAFKPIYLLAEVELRDAVLSILRGDEQLAYGVLRQDEELDSLYAAEMKRIFTKASSAMFYDFQVGTGLLFILRAIERIGDHAKQLAVPSFYRLTGAGSAAPVEKSRAL